MKYFISRLLIVVLLVGTQQPVLAYQYCDPTPYVVFHINGINTTADDAKMNRDEIKNSLPATLNGKRLKVHLAYNVTRGYLTDLVDTYEQKKNEFPGVTFAQFIAAFITATNLTETLPAASQALLAYVRNYISNAMANSAYVSLNDIDLASIAADIRSEAQGGQTVLLVPHSQGNLYANSAFAQLTNGPNALASGSIGIMGVASPATFVAGHGTYITSTNDLVIGGLRLQYPLTLPANTWVKASYFDPSGHNFVAVYMNPEMQSRTQIVQGIKNNFLRLNTPIASAENRAVKLEFLKFNSFLGWGSNGPTTYYQNVSSLYIIRPDGIRYDDPYLTLWNVGIPTRDVGAIACSAFTKSVVGRIESTNTDLLPGEYRLMGYSIPDDYGADLTVLSNSSSSTKHINRYGIPYGEGELATILVSKKADGNPQFEIK